MFDKKKLKVLLVEDDFLISDRIKRTLFELGYMNIHELSSGKEAIDKVCEIKPDIILMDIQMPDVTGIEATIHIQNTCPVPIIILTAFETDSLLNQASEAGASAYLVKPLKKMMVDRVFTVAFARHKELMTIKDLNKQLEIKNQQLQLLNEEVEEKNQKLQDALNEIKTLKGIIPICSKCKKIRDDVGFWNDVESYVSKYTEAEFSHSLCPDCLKSLYGNEDWFLRTKRDK